MMSELLTHTHVGNNFTDYNATLIYNFFCLYPYILHPILKLLVLYFPNTLSKTVSYTYKTIRFFHHILPSILGSLISQILYIYIYNLYSLFVLCSSMGLGSLVSYIQHYIIVQNNFSTLNIILCFSYSPVTF